MAPTDTLKEFAALQRVSDQSTDHKQAVRYVQCKSVDGRSTQLLSGMSAVIAGSVAALLHERLPEGSVLAGMVTTVAGGLWAYGAHLERASRSHLSTLHAPRIHMILDQIREAVPSLKEAADEAEQLLLAGK